MEKVGGGGAEGDVPYMAWSGAAIKVKDREAWRDAVTATCSTGKCGYVKKTTTKKTSS